MGGVSVSRSLTYPSTPPWVKADHSMIIEPKEAWFEAHRISHYFFCKCVPFLFFCRGIYFLPGKGLQYIYTSKCSFQVPPRNSAISFCCVVHPQAHIIWILLSKCLHAGVNEAVRKRGLPNIYVTLCLNPAFRSEDPLSLVRKDLIKSYIYYYSRLTLS